jgi:protein-disulfide isomerase
MQRERDNIMRTDGVGEGNFKMDHTPPPDIKNAIYISADGIHPQGGNMDAVKHAKVFTPAVI